MRGLLRELLRERNYEVTAVGSAEEALQMHIAQPFRLMLVDWTLPGLSGLDLCRKVRATPGGKDVFILVITGRNRAEELGEVLEAGASDYLSKPIDPHILSTRLRIAERTIRDAMRQETERKEIESRLAFADRMASAGTLAAGVAHELNNPLMYVLSNLRLMREELDAADPTEWIERAKRQLDEAIQGAVRMQNIVRDLKTFSRPDDESPHNADLREVLESAINICWNEVRHRATLERDFAETPPVAAAESRLVQVFVNLLINAAQAMSEPSAATNRIVVRTRTRQDGCAVVEVIDNGTGIEPERLGRIFDPFFTTKGLAEGTGLGLSICRNIVEDAGGSIEVCSEPGSGTTFTVRLPASDRAEVSEPRRAAGTSAVVARARVVVVDDEPLVGRSIRRALRGHEVQVFSSGQDAVERLCADEPFDLIFCDLMMPEVSGMEVYEKVAAHRPDLASRFVFMTGGAFTAQAREFLKTTPLVCLEKPFELDQIREIVRERAGIGN
jgi:two-component system cell cycle sensor histidine kinase/response regulator CckA